jgi:arabinofuranosyltransferase
MVRHRSRPRPLWTNGTILIIAGLLAALAVFAIFVRRLLPYTTDDAFISLRHAQNLARGHGLVYNAGERVDGYTNFLWTVILAIPFLLRWDPVLFIKGAGVALALGSAVQLFRLGEAATDATRGTGRRGVETSRLLAFLPAAWFLLTPSVMVDVVEGLETVLFVLLLLTAVTLFLRERDGIRFPRSAVALAALALTRPDGILFAPFLFAMALLEKRNRRYLLRAAGTFALIFGFFFILHWTYYGHPLSNTYYAKGAGGWYLAERGWTGLRRFVHECGGWGWIAAVPALLSSRTRRVAWTLAGVVLLRFAFQVWSGGPWGGGFRFLTPALPFIYLLSALGIAVVIRPGRERSVAGAAACVAITLLILMPGWRAYRSTEAGVLRYARALSGAHRELGMGIRAGTSPDAVIAMDDAGLGPFLAERRNIDMLGLNDAHIAHLPGRYVEKFDVRYVLGRRPDLIVLIASRDRPSSRGDFRLRGHAAMFADSAFQSAYAWSRAYTFSSDYRLAVYRRLDSSALSADF